MSQQATYLYEFGPFRIDTKNRLLFRDGQPIPLKPKVAETLLVLVEDCGRVLGKDELIEKLWPDTFVEEANLTQNIYVLRKALDTNEGSQPYIETIPRRGYRFAGEVRKVQLDDAKERSPARFPRWMWIIVVVLLGISTAILWRAFATRTEPGVSKPNVRTVAVLPFKPLTAGSADEYIGEGMADALITKLSNSQRITVRPTSAVLRYASATQDPIEAGRALAVDAVLDGKVQRSGDRVRVTVQLLRVQDGSSLWGDQYDEDFTNIFALQDSISAKAARALTLELTGTESRSMRRRYTENVTAYESYLQGRFFWNKRNAAAFRKAIEHFEHALSVDPNYALAYGGLADCYIRLNEYGTPMTQDALPKARAAVTKALTIDDSLAEAHATLAFIRFRHDWDFVGAESEFKRSIQLDPNYSEAYQWYAFFLLAVGKETEADAQMKRAQELDPLSVTFNSNLALYLYFRNQFDQSLEQCRKTLTLDPTFSTTRLTFALVVEQKGSNREAIAELRQLHHSNAKDPIIAAALGHVLAKTGQTREAAQLLADLQGRSKNSYVPPYSFAILYAGLGDQTKAMDWLERGVQDRSLRPVWLRFDPRLDRLRQHDRYVRLVQQMGLN